MTRAILNVDENVDVNFSLNDAVAPGADSSGTAILSVDDVGDVLLTVTTNDGGSAASLYLTRQGALDLAHYLINLVHPHAG